MRLGTVPLVEKGVNLWYNDTGNVDNLKMFHRHLYFSSLYESFKTSWSACRNRDFSAGDHLYRRPVYGADAVSGANHSLLRCRRVRFL